MEEKKKHMMDGVAWMCKRAAENKSMSYASGHKERERVVSWNSNAMGSRHFCRVGALHGRGFEAELAEDGYQISFL